MDINRIVKKIKSLEIQGAKQIAVESLKFLKVFCKKNGFGRKFEKACDRLEKTRPTAVVLHNCLEILKKERTLKTIDKVLNQLDSTKQIAKTGKNLIKKNSVIMTHCHSGEALSLIKSAKRIKVIATETEPKEQGIKTVKELAKAKIPVTLITDSAVSFFMKDVDYVIVGADALRKQGLVNKIGTRNLALAAKEYKKPFYVVANTLKIDKRKNIIIEERPASEVYHKLKGVKIRNPAFDITPWKFISKIITEKGVFTPKKIRRLL